MPPRFKIGHHWLYSQNINNNILLQLRIETHIIIDVIYYDIKRYILEVKMKALVIGVYQAIPKMCSGSLYLQVSTRLIFSIQGQLRYI